MAMAAKGLAKLIEECGELQQIAGKKLAYFHCNNHPDDKGPLKERLEDECADVMAAILFVIEAMELDLTKIEERTKNKYDKFSLWHRIQNNNLHGIDRR